MRIFITFLITLALSLSALATNKNVLIIDPSDTQERLELHIEDILTDIGMLGTVDRTFNNAEFNSLGLLENYHVVVFPSAFTLTFTQQAVFETFLDDGGKTITIGQGVSAYTSTTWQVFAEEVSGFYSNSFQPLAVPLTLNPSLLNTLNNNLPLTWHPNTMIYEDTYVSPSWYTLYNTDTQPVVLYNEYGTSRRATIAMDIDYSDTTFKQLGINIFYWLCQGGNLPIEFKDKEEIAEIQPQAFFSFNDQLVVQGDFPRRTLINITLYGMTGDVIYSHNVADMQGSIAIKTPFIPSFTPYAVVIKDLNRGQAYYAGKIVKR